MTAKQKAARAKFKAVVKEASKLRKKNPKLTQAQAVKQAWAISYSKEGKGKKLGATKKSIYKVGDKVYRNYDFLKKSIPGKVIYVSGQTPYIYKLKLKDGFSNYLEEDLISKKPKYKTSEIGATKKKAAPTKVKAKKSKRTSEMHTDTKSHNVNIRVISGLDKINTHHVKELQHLTNSLAIAQYHLKKSIEQKKASKDKSAKNYFGRMADRFRSEIQAIKQQITIVKKLIK